MNAISKNIILLIAFYSSYLCQAQYFNPRQLKLLEKAYHHRSLKKINTFFENLHKEIPAISDSEMKTLRPIQKEAYEVFKVYYKRSEERHVGKECRSRWSPYH